MLELRGARGYKRRNPDFQADVVLQCRAYRRKVSVPEFLEIKAGLGEGAQYDTHRGTDFLKVERFGYLTESLRAFQGYHGVCLCFDGLSCGSDHLLFTVAQNLDSKKNTVLPPVAAPTGNRVEAALFHTRTSNAKGPTSNGPNLGT